MKRMIEVRQPKRQDDLTLVIQTNQATVAVGHRVLPRGGRHRDKRRPNRVNDKGWLKGG